MWCTGSRKRCAECSTPVCARHASASNGCCMPCIQKQAAIVSTGWHATTPEEEDEIEAIGGPRASMYGEITPLGFRTLARRLSLGSGDVFVDLGSGLGRVVLQAARDWGVERACGVEYAASRHDLAVEALEEEPTAVAERVCYIRGDCADPQVWQESLGDVTVAYVANLLFGAELMERTARQLEACASLRTVASYRQWPEGLVGFREDEPERCDTSWKAPDELIVVGASKETGGSLLYIYVRNS